MAGENCKKKDAQSMAAQNQREKKGAGDRKQPFMSYLQCPTLSNVAIGSDSTLNYEFTNDYSIDDY